MQMDPRTAGRGPNGNFVGGRRGVTKGKSRGRFSRPANATVTTRPQTTAASNATSSEAPPPPPPLTGNVSVSEAQ